MSAISSNLTDPNDPYSSLYQLLNNSNQSLSNTTSNVNAAPSSPLSELSTDSTTESSQSTSHHGHHHHGIPSQIENAVTSALQSATPGSDPNQTIQNAIASVLQQANPQDPTTTTPTTTDPTTTDPTTQSPTSFNQLLQSFGVDPKQFQQDLQAALQTTQSQNPNSPDSNSVDFATLFRNFPPGSAVNTVG